tara:strand:- start:434 stop:943 length:510 start_codon:yes stop_codon:yes gene_type:complete
MYSISNPENFRNNVRSKLKKIIKTTKNATNLEIGIFNYCLKEATQKKVIRKWENKYFVQLYIDRLRTIFMNLQNEELQNKILNKEIKAEELAFLTHQEMKPSKWDKYIEAKMKRDKYKFENNIEASTDSFTCRQCKSNKCSYYQMQTRSADEPMTTFVSCITCGARWKC